MDVIIKCKSPEQAEAIAEHFIGSRPSEEFLNDRLIEKGLKPIEKIQFKYGTDAITITIK